MLHLPTFNLGRAAGVCVAATGAARPDSIDEIPGLAAILDQSETLTLFFPSSFIEGFVSAWDLGLPGPEVLRRLPAGRTAGGKSSPVSEDTIFPRSLRFSSEYRRLRPAVPQQTTARGSRTAPWPCPNCRAEAGEPCLTGYRNGRPKPVGKGWPTVTTFLPTIHIRRWNARPGNYERSPMAGYKLRLIRPLNKILFRGKKAPIRGVSRRTIWRYNGGDWIPDDGKPDLVFVSLDNDVPVVHAAIWRDWDRRLAANHPNNLARAAAHEFCEQQFGHPAIVVNLKQRN